MNNTPTLTLEWVRQERARHKQALADLDAVERVLLSVAASAPPAPVIAGNDFVQQHGGKRRALLAIIAATPEGLTTPETIRKAIDLGVMDVTTANVSPKLSESRKQDLLELRDGGRWKITEKGRDFLTPKTN